MAILAKSLLALVLGDFRSFSLFTAWHQLYYLWMDKCPPGNFDRQQ
jgi:hypothetical protein